MVYHTLFENTKMNGEHVHGEFIVNSKFPHHKRIKMIEVELGTKIGETNKCGGKLLDIYFHKEINIHHCEGY